MPFSEPTKVEIRRRAHYKCCLCQAIGVEIHHIQPQADGGSDDIENGAPLCPSCHVTLGANPTKRKLIREARDHWYEICEKRYAPDADRLSRIEGMLSAFVSQNGDTAESEFSSLGEILKHLYDFRFSSISEDNVEEFFKRFFLFPVEDDSVNQAKQLFYEEFGRETSKRLCGYVLSKTHPQTAVGLTDEELEQSGQLAFVYLLFLSFNHELCGSGKAIHTRVCSDGELRHTARENP